MRLGGDGMKKGRICGDDCETLILQEGKESGRETYSILITNYDKLEKFDTGPPR